MSIQLYQAREFCESIAFVVVSFVLLACTASTTTVGTGSGGDTNAGSPPGAGQAATSEASNAAGASGSPITAGSYAENGNASAAASGAVATGGSGPVSGGSAPTVCDVPEPNCAGLSGCALTICVLIRGSGNDKIPGDCSCLSGDQLKQCCAQVRQGMEKYNCIDLTDFPECEIRLECPMNVIDSLKTNPYEGAEQISQECANCICASCLTQFDHLASNGETAITLLQCAIANKARKDCVVCNPPPCDTTLGTNLLTGPCSQELLASCPDCSCGGPFDLNCLSLAGCLSETSVATQLPCRSANSAMECMVANCPACPSIPDCPSSF
ncbi:MAG: hypothetical protein JXA30_03670 [Deltaproteobacteria bacterium]|nr:hypothetical protein [Deltaproteobacteria bacterium]